VLWFIGKITEVTLLLDQPYCILS